MFSRQSGLLFFFNFGTLKWKCFLGFFFFFLRNVQFVCEGMAPHGGTQQELRIPGTVGLGSIWLDSFHWAHGFLIFYFFYVFGRIGERWESASCWSFNETDGHNFYDFKFGFFSQRHRETNASWNWNHFLLKTSDTMELWEIFFCCFGVNNWAIYEFNGPACF